MGVEGKEYQISSGYKVRSGQKGGATEECLASTHAAKPKRVEKEGERIPEP